MTWQKPDAELVARFDALLPAAATIERRKMFGCPCAFVAGNMFVGVHESRLILRLAEKRREQLLAKGTVTPFSPGGRTMREYVAIEAAAGRAQKELGALTHEAFTFASSLPPKVKRVARRPAKRTPKEAKRVGAR